MNPQIPIGIVWKRVGCVLGIEPNKHKIPRFLGEFIYHTDHSANPKSPNSPNALPMSNMMWYVGFFGSLNFGISGESWRTVGLR